MKITFLETVSGNIVFFQGGQTYELEAQEAANWIKTGLAKAVELPIDPEPQAEQPKAKAKKKKEAE